MGDSYRLWIQVMRAPWVPPGGLMSCGGSGLPETVWVTKYTLLPMVPLPPPVTTEPLPVPLHNMPLMFLVMKLPLVSANTEFANDPPVVGEIAIVQPVACRAKRRRDAITSGSAG